MAVNPLVSLPPSCARRGPTSEMLGFLLASHELSEVCRSRMLCSRWSVQEWGGLEE